MDSYKSAKKVSKLVGEEQLLDDDIEVKVEFEIVGDGGYVLKMKRVNPSSNNEDEVERAKNLAQMEQCCTITERFFKTWERN
ncbi:unnamed protein product [Sphenostylis stenocarpa]|uniref:Uncharacterized protein n=1 Tax=Sphenostylis stenocarpa TaxID=92480 RepID=A0AA86SXK5_9FABA|nr:unnamed protein product [Sphenostylis stenocarpa]